MNSEILHWLRAQLGSDIALADLTQRYQRLGSARAVVAEVLHERITALLSDPLKVTVNGIATIDNSANVAALERSIAQLDHQRVPDDVLLEESSLSAVPLVARPRR
ncbi:hypothetical protein ACFY12_34735 [Streptomyces sp. NPDC001339]|uniref:hypothetical protein n=1 Tax=Streptomyces sp. NPDC001339 TaxID=3364563 RepID=UPI0036C6C082